MQMEKQQEFLEWHQAQNAKRNWKFKINFNYNKAESRVGSALKIV